MPDDRVAFNNFVETFCTATRQYAKKQMQWFRRDPTFMFLPVNLENEAELRVEDTARLVFQYCTMSKEEYGGELLVLDADGNDNDSLSFRTKRGNELQAKGMKFYTPKRYKLIEGTDVYDYVLKEADLCTSRMQGGLDWHACPP